MQLEIEGVNANHQLCLDVLAEKGKLDEFMYSGFFSKLETLFDTFKFEAVKADVPDKQAASPAERVQDAYPELTREIEKIETHARLLRDLEADCEFKSKASLERVRVEDVQLPPGLPLGDNWISECFALEQYYKTKTELHKLLVVDNNRASKLTPGSAPDSKLLVLDMTFPSDSLPLSTAESTTLFKYPSESVRCLELPSLKAHELMQVAQLPGSKLLLVYQPEVRSKQVGLAVVQDGQDGQYCVQYYPLTKSPKDSFEGQYVRFDSRRSVILIRESSTSLRVCSLNKHWAKSEKELRASGSLIKVEDFIKDFALESFDCDMGSFLFLAVLLRDNKVKSFVLEPNENYKHTPLQVILKTSQGRQLSKQADLSVDQSAILPVAIECKKLSSKSNKVGLFVLGFSPKDANEQEQGEEYVPSVASFVFKLQLKGSNLAAVLSKGIEVSYIEVSNTASSDTDKDEHFDLATLQKVASKRTRVSSALVSPAVRTAGADSFSALLSIPQLARVVLFAWKLPQDESPIQDFAFAITQQAADSTAPASVYKVFEEEALRSKPETPERNLICVASKLEAVITTRKPASICNHFDICFASQAD